MIMMIVALVQGKSIVRAYLGSIPREQRQVRLLFIGKNLKTQQYRWLHHVNYHPWEGR